MCKIGVIDSGMGGISTLSALIKILPNHDYIYVSDYGNLPYGDKSADFIYQRINFISTMLKGMGVGVIVVACNTATAAGIEKLRQDKDMIFVGVEPAIKPALQELKQGKALVLLTPSALNQPKMAALIKRFDSDKLIISPQKDLAALIENNINNLHLIKKDLNKILQPLKNNNIKSVVLGCTHYCLIRNQIAEFFNAKTYDGNTGVALRVNNLLKQNPALCLGKSAGIKFITL